VAPPRHDWFQIYMWLFQRYKPDVAETNDLKPDRADLNAQQQELLTGLRRWVFKRQMEHLKQRRKGEHEPAATAAAKPAEPEIVQAKLF
ncbi:MAG: hypothetical protein Q8P22_05835, partial [Chloroflexota bacterium]|nr:hypothetical protein [Chloroflexota bacterium]